MADSPILAIPLLSTSQAAKETTINTMVAYLERAMNDTITVPLAGANYTITATDLKRYFAWKFTGAGVASEITITPMKRLFMIDNLANGNDLTLKSGAATLTIPAGGVVVVMATLTPTLVSVADSTVMGGGGGVTTFTGLSDAFPSYATHAKHVIRVKNDLTGLEAVALKYEDLADVDMSPIANGDVMIWNSGTTKFEAGPMTGGGGASGDIAPAVRAASTAALIIADVISGYTLDGVILATDDRVLIKNQAGGVTNGIYVVGVSSSVRADDMEDLATFDQGYLVPVLEGDTQAKTLWILTTAMAAVGSSNLQFILPESRFDLLKDYDDAVTKTDGMVMIWDDIAKLWVPSVTSTSLPTGGSTGQAMVKQSGTDYDFIFRTLVPAGGTAGQVLSKIDGTDYNSQWIPIPAPTVPQRTVSTTTDTAVLGDAGGFIFGSNAGDITMTIPLNSSVAYPIGTTLTWVQELAGKCLVVGAVGVTVNKPATFLAKSAEQWATIAAVKIATDIWVLTGQLEAV